jgi:hypothetical protein
VMRVISDQKGEERARVSEEHRLLLRAGRRGLD